MSKLSISSKIFVTKEKKQMFKRNSHLSFERVEDSSSFSEEECESNKFSIKLQNSDDEGNISQSSATNYTSDSVNSYSDQDCTSESSENEQELASTPLSSSVGVNFEEESPKSQNCEINLFNKNSCKQVNIRNIVRNSDSNKHAMKHGLKKEMACESTSSSCTSSPLVNQAEKKRKRRAGRKHKKNLQPISDENLNSDQEPQKYKTEL